MMYVQRKDALVATTQETALSNRWSGFYFISHVQKQTLQKKRKKRKMYLECASVTLHENKQIIPVASRSCQEA